MNLPKFKVLCINRKMWLPRPYYLSQEGIVFHFTGDGHLEATKSGTHIPVFYTHRKDKNNKEIYGGDIWKLDGMFYVVVFRETQWDLEPVREPNLRIDFRRYSSHGEVVANIYEYPNFFKEDRSFFRTSEPTELSCPCGGGLTAFTTYQTRPKKAPITGCILKCTLCGQISGEGSVSGIAAGAGPAALNHAKCDFIGRRDRRKREAGTLFNALCELRKAWTELWKSALRAAIR